MTTRFSEWRRASGFTLAECSGLSGYSVPHLSRVERGERALSAQGKVKLARSLGVAVSDLFEPDALRGRHQTESRAVNRATYEVDPATIPDPDADLIEALREASWRIEHLGGHSDPMPGLPEARDLLNKLRELGWTVTRESEATA